MYHLFMTTSRFFGEKTLLDLSGLYLGLLESVEQIDRSKGKETALQRLQYLEGKIGILEKNNFHLWSVEEYFGIKPKEYLDSMKAMIEKVVSGNYHKKDLVDEIERARDTIMPIIQRAQVGYAH